VVGLLAVALGVGRSQPAPANKTAPTNVLLIVVDDLNLSLGCYGNSVVKSPNIDRLAARGVRFDRSYCQYPLCNPSRVSFLSGRRPETSGVYVLTTPARQALPDAVMLPQFFRQHGYFSGGAGKIFHSEKMSDAASWDFYEDQPPQDSEEQAAIDARYGAPGGKTDGQPRAYQLSTDGTRTRDGKNVRTILRLMEEKVVAHQPFFLAAGFHKPHLPWTAPKKFFDIYPAGSISLPEEPAMREIPPIAMQTELSGNAQPDSRVEAIRGYYACISFTDSHVGLLLDQLDRLDLWKNTVVVLMGDNGFHLGDHGGLWAKLSAFDASTHVPLMIAGAGVPAGKVISTPVELLDVFPTLADLAAFAPPRGLEGQSLVPAMRGTAVGTRGPVSSVVFHYDVAKGVDVVGRTVISDQWRYTEWEGGKAGREFYSHRDDPAEYENLISSPLVADRVRDGESYLAGIPTPKPGPALRPPALLPPAPKTP
jgi:uncharacterized sulfatase